MMSLSTLSNTSRPHKKVQRVGRGVGSKRGKTCCRGVKGDKARRGYKAALGKEGGQLPLYRKLPTKGFPNGRFKSHVHAISLRRIEQLFEEGSLVNLQTLRERGYAPRQAKGGLKILSQGVLKKKITIEAHAFSKKALEKLKDEKISYKIISEDLNQNV